MAAASATGLPAYHKMFAPLVPNFIQTVGPYRFRCELEDGRAAAVHRSRGARLRRRAREDDARARVPTPSRPFMAEPVQGAGGVIVPPDDYWPKLRQIADRHNVLLIADEVITGFGRTGQVVRARALGRAAGHRQLRQGRHQRATCRSAASWSATRSRTRSTKRRWT